MFAVLLLGFGYLHFVGRDPVTWARHRLDAVRGTLVAVPDVTARSTSSSGVVKDFEPGNAVDGDSKTAWATGFDGPTRVTGRTCTASIGVNGLVLTASQDITLRAIKVHSGFPDNAGDLEWRPRTLELWFPDGTCQRIAVANSAEPQLIKIHSVKANAVRIAVVAGYQPKGGSAQPTTAITEIALMTRPK